jgi:hypothetical protein
MRMQPNMTKIYEKNNVRVRVTSYIVVVVVGDSCAWQTDVVKHVNFARKRLLQKLRCVVAVPKNCIYIANNCVITMLSAVLRRVSRPVVMRTGMCIA